MVIVGIALVTDAQTKALTNLRSWKRRGAMTGAGGGGDLTRGERPLGDDGAQWHLVAPTLTAVHFSDRTRWVVALHERRMGCH